MKLLYKLLFALVTLLVAVYYLSFYLLPAVTIVNSSAAGIAQANIDLPTSHLDFGAIAKGQSNRLHYDLRQPQEGQYRYTIKFTNAVELQGSCGKVRTNEFNKRVIISIATDGQISCNHP